MLHINHKNSKKKKHANQCSAQCHLSHTKTNAQRHLSHKN